LKVYNHSMHGRGTIFVTPGREHEENSDWIKVSRDPDGREIREPIMFTVRFADGVAEVPDSLGAYMIKKGLARKSPIILSEGVAA
jgi:hypothetical protein